MFLFHCWKESRTADPGQQTCYQPPAALSLHRLFHFSFAVKARLGGLHTVTNQLFYKLGDDLGAVSSSCHQWGAVSPPVLQLWVPSMLHCLAQDLATNSQPTSKEVIPGFHQLVTLCRATPTPSQSWISPTLCLCRVQPSPGTCTEVKFIAPLKSQYTAVH